MNRAASRRPQRAFTLAELLTVVALITLLIGFGTMAIGRMMAARRMEEAGRLIMDEFNRARQLAAGWNLRVEVRFVQASRHTGQPPTFHLLQTGSLNAAGEFQPVHTPTRLPEGVILATEAALSPLIGAQTPVSSGSTAYTTLVIRPGGMLEPRAGLPMDRPWFLTAIFDRESGSSPDALSNFATVQIDPWTARPSLHTP